VESLICGIKTKPFIRLNKQLKPGMLNTSDFEVDLLLMKVLNVKRTSVILLKSLLIVVILLQVCIFVSFHKAEQTKSLSSKCQGPDVVWVQHAGISRFVLNPGDAFQSPGMGLIPSNFTLLIEKGSFFKTTLLPFHKGGVALALTTINAP
jgi:hypothetical protein